jgi:hypothetical protein
MGSIGNGQVHGLEIGMEGWPSDTGFEMEVPGVVESFGESDGARCGLSGQEHLESDVLFIADGQRRSDCCSAVASDAANEIRIEDEFEEA